MLFFKRYSQDVKNDAPIKLDVCFKAPYTYTRVGAKSSARDVLVRRAGNTSPQSLERRYVGFETTWKIVFRIKS